MLRRTFDALARLGRARARDERQRGAAPCNEAPCNEAPCPGDLFVFQETADFDVQWAVVQRDPQAPHRFLVVPADLDPRVGSGDVCVPAGGSHGALTLRCRFGVWLQEKAFDLEKRTGSISAADLEHLLAKREEIDGGELHRSRGEIETDEEPEYQDWGRQILRRAQAALAESFAGAAALA